MLEPSHNDELPVIPGKRYFTIGEVSELCAVKPHVLRYWETEFPQLRPRKGSNGTRQYRERDLALVDRIRVLRIEEKLTLQAARKRLVEDRSRTEPVGQLGLALPEPDKPERPELDRDRVVQELREVLDILRFGRRSW